MSAIDSAKPYEARQRELTEAISSRESKRDKTVNDLNRRVGDEQRAALKDVQRLQDADRAAVEKLACDMARDEFKVLTKAVSDVLNTNGGRNECEELSAQYRRLEARSRALLPVNEGAGGSVMARTHRLVWAVAQVAQLSDGRGCDPAQSYHFLGIGLEASGVLYGPGHDCGAGLGRLEANAVAALMSCQPIRIWDQLKPLVQVIDELLDVTREIPPHIDRPARLEALRFGGLPEATLRRIREIKAAEDEALRPERDRLNAEHEQIWDQKRRTLLGLPSAAEMLAAAQRALGIGIDPYGSSAQPAATAPEAAE